MTKVELLAPAGNMNCLKAAINNGADAVYLGSKNFSARAFADNFSNDELIEAIRFAHLRNKKVYVTLNTLLNEFEIENALKLVYFYYENKVDALLIQDLGLYYLIKNKYPDFELHASTQMHIHNIEGVKTCQKLGFKRVVLARESTLDFIKEASQIGIEIETFVHGAICVSYSGQCLLSSSSKNRSANKGMCAQCCRLKYDLLDENQNKIKTKTPYLLSPKDMMLIDDIPELIEAGVNTFKIEGRMKSSGYVGYVTRYYRKAIDSYYENKFKKINNIDLDNLKVLFNRNFTDDYLFNLNNVFGQKSPNHLGIKIGEVSHNRDGYTFIKLEKELNQFDGIRIEDFGMIANMIYKNNLLVNKGNINEIIALKTNKKLKGNVYKTLDYKLEEEIKNTLDLRNPLDLKIEIKADNFPKIEGKIFDKVFNYEAKIKAQKALKAPLNYETIKKQFSKLNDSAYYLNDLTFNGEDVFMTIKDLNEIRRDFINKLDEFILNSFVRVENIIDYELNDISYTDINDDMEQIGNVIYLNNDKYQINNVINIDSDYSDSDNIVISENGGLFKDGNKIAYYTLNCLNSYTYEFLNRLGFKYIVLSSEIKDLEIEALINNFEKRNHIKIKPFLFTEGKRILMYIKANPFDEYIDYQNKYYLNDGTNSYLINKNNNITELIDEDYQRDNNKYCLSLKIK